MRALFCAALVALVSACSSEPSASAGTRILVVDGSGAPIRGAFLVLLPEVEDPSSRLPKYTSAELGELTSDQQGMIHAELDDCLWDSDRCYHFRIRRGGFEDVEMTVSRDLMPPVLRIEMKRPAPAGQEPGRPPGG
jgi:hypothetical protein